MMQGHQTALHLSSMYGHTATVVALLERGADINAKIRLVHHEACSTVMHSYKRQPGCVGVHISHLCALTNIIHDCTV